MAEYIRREDAIKCIEGQCVDGKMWGNDDSEGTLIQAYSAIDDLMEIPPADVAPVRHWRWVQVIVHVEFEDGFVGRVEECCTACHEPNGRRCTYFCPNCGAKMDGGKDA